MYLIDTNILIYHFNRTIPGDARSKLRRIFKDHFNISVITKMEFLGFEQHTEESFINILQNALKKTKFSRLVSYKYHEQILLGCGRRPLLKKRQSL